MNLRLSNNNKIVREALAKHRIYQYQLAKILGVNEGTVCRKLRDELPEDEQKRIVSLIEEHAGQIANV